ncbi:MAG TPA: hypothetical protein VLA43_00175 [Longimicrobiales bacterium]|nr:hypothetical protein [Longimicrobiales bacterium]
MTGGVGTDAGLRALVRLSGALALGADQDLGPFLEEAARWAPAEEVEEALLQSYLFLGYPAALNALAEWRRVSGRDAPPEAPGGWDAWGSRGESVCREVYGRTYGDLRENISRLSPDMDRWMVVEGYGKVLGRPGMELWRRECCIAAILMVLGAAPQLRSHLRGALRTGTPPQVLDGVVQSVLGLVPPERQDRAREVWNEVRTRWENT